MSSLWFCLSWLLTWIQSSLKSALQFSLKSSLQSSLKSSLNWSLLAFVLLPWPPVVVGTSTPALADSVPYIPIAPAPSNPLGLVNLTSCERLDIQGCRPLQSDHLSFCFPSGVDYAYTINTRPPGPSLNSWTSLKGLLTFSYTRTCTHTRTYVLLPPHPENPFPPNEKNKISSLILTPNLMIFTS